MAREHARVKLSIWDDDDFRALSPAAQHLYFVLMTHPKLDYAGVTDWRPSRISGFADAWTTAAVELAAQELSEALYIVIDLETEELLIRSFIRSDEFMDQPNMAVAMKKAHRSISSGALRGIVIHELRRLHKDKPDLKGWAKVSELLDKPSFDPSDYPSFRASDHPSIDPTIYPSGKGQPNPSGTPSGQPSPTTNSLLPTPNSQHPTPKDEDQDLGGESNETLQAASGPNQPPRCNRHPDGNPANTPCAGCARVREYGDRLEAQARTEQAAAAANCPHCHGTNWREDEEGNPTRKCDHRRTA
jgi:hypothetical protein